ncbi:beta-lactamase-like protein [Plectosphaerella cucumerina]|uniref:Beta-lactamase-like protein n=1 Tax=Plectosphaerella cucumerina TaxID=40658 RepID=A0A8K0X5B7_9PEZI|nr:beta-lactamase-like protein [Plectosphaerella cucumerina]
MCRLPRNSIEEPCSTAAGVSGPAFTCEKLNSTTFVLEEHDRWSENPLIYAKVLPETIILIDTGCGGSKQTPGIEGTLKDFLENTPVKANNSRPLNHGATRQYTVICTHCHYDHIGGISEFADDSQTTIWASALGRSIIENPTRLSSASLCRFVGIATPKYAVTNWAEDRDCLSNVGSPGSGLVVYQTPGHTPDQVAIWDPTERHLFVGDTCYEDAPILFPNGGNILQYGQSIQKLRGLVRGWDRYDNLGTDDRAKLPHRVKIASGHNTRNADAEELLSKVDNFLAKVSSGEVEGEDITTCNYAWAGGEPAVEFRERGSDLYFQGLRSVFSKLLD